MTSPKPGSRAGTLLQARSITYAYPGGVRALDGVDLDLGAGELLVVIGPNGSGKSTLVKALAGLLQPDQGTVQLDGSPIAALSPRSRARRIAFVPQFLPALPDVSVFDFVASGRYAHVERHGLAGALLGASAGTSDKPLVESALAACDVLDLRERGMSEISSGQRQRVMVARAIAQESAVLLVDEPTNALDPEHQIGVFELLSSLRTQSRAALVVTHDLNLAGQYATRLVLLDEGRVVAQGAPDTVLVREVLAPVYGENLYFGTWPSASGRSGNYVIPCRTN